MRCANCGRFVEKNEQMFKRRIVTGQGRHHQFENDRLVCADCLPEVDAQIEENAKKKKRFLIFFILITVIFLLFFAYQWFTFPLHRH